MNKWIKISEQLPLEGSAAFTKIEDEKGERNHQFLVRRGAFGLTLVNQRMFITRLPIGDRD